MWRLARGLGAGPIDRRQLNSGIRMARQPQTHETLRRTKDVKLGGDRAFGFVFTVVFQLVGLWLLTGRGAPRVLALIVAAAFLVV